MAMTLDDAIMQQYMDATYPMPEELPPEDMTQMATEMAAGTEPEGAAPMSMGQFAETAADVPAGLVKGAIQGTIGLPGDIESLIYGVREILNRGAGESALDAFVDGLEQRTILPTTENVKGWLDANVGPLVPEGTDPRRVEAAKTAEFVGELGGAGQTIIEGTRAAARGARQIGKQVSEKVAQQSAIQANESLAKRMTDDWENLSFEYSQLRESKDGQILNTDIARELSPEYWKDRTRSVDIHEAASAVVKKLYADKLSQPTPEGKESIVVFSAGGTGAGKSTGLKSTGLLPEWEQTLGPELQRAEMIYDTNMNTLESAITKIDQALDSGRDVAIVYTFRDPLEALSEGSLKRATRQEEQFGTGRTVPIVEHIKTHLGARDTIPKLAEHYKGNPRVEIAVIDNSKGAGNQEITTLDQLPELGDKLSLERQAYEIAKQQYDSGNISESTFRGTTKGLPKRATSNAARKTSGNNEVPNRRGGGQSARGNNAKVVRSSAPTNKEAQ